VLLYLFPFLLEKVRLFHLSVSLSSSFSLRYKTEGDANEGFATFVTEEIAEIISSFSSKSSPMDGISATHFGDEESDESQHSSHPMVSGLTSGSSQTKSGGGKAKLSTIKSGKKSTSPKKSAGYSNSVLDDSQDGL
jgi:hypothetical protein